MTSIWEPNVSTISVVFGGGNVYFIASIWESNVAVTAAIFEGSNTCFIAAISTSNVSTIVGDERIWASAAAVFSVLFVSEYENSMYL